MTTKTYTLTVTENQARIIAHAVELMSRIQTGQWFSFIDWLPQQHQFSRHELREKLQPVMTEHFSKTKPDNCPYVIDGWNNNYNILAEYVPETARVAWDLQKVIEHRLAWDRNPEGGFTVDFDEPAHAGTEPLAVMKQVL